MLRIGRVIVRTLLAERKLGAFVTHSVVPSLYGDRAQRRPIFVMSTPSAGSTWIGALLGHARTHVFIHEVKLLGGKTGKPLAWLARAPALVPGRALYVLFESFERGRLWTLPEHTKGFRVKRPELLMPFNLGPFDLDAPAETHGRVETIDTAGNHVRIAPLLRRAYPGAIMCFIVRDPRDVCLSIKYRKRFGQKTSIEGWARSYVETLSEVEKHRESCGIDVMRYEDWKADARRELGKFVARHRLSMTDLEIEEAVGQHDEGRMRQGTTARLGNLSEKPARGWREELGAVDKASIKPILEQVLISTGYETSTNW